MKIDIRHFMDLPKAKTVWSSYLKRMSILIVAFWMVLSTCSIAFATGIDTGLLYDDDFVNNLPIGFTFNFDGTPCTTFGVSANGWLSLSNQADYASNNNPLPDPSLGSLAILPFFDDLQVGTGKIYYQTIGTAPYRQLVVQYHDVAFFGTPIIPMGDFEVILFESTNQIKFQYRALRNERSFGNSATIGIVANVSASQFSYNTSSLHEKQVILYNGSNPNSLYDWIDLSGLTADVPLDGGDTATTAINFTWNATPGANAYRLELATATDGTGIVDAVTLGDVTSYSYPTAALIGGNRYYARLTASIDAGTIWQNPSGFSDGITVELPPVVTVSTSGNPQADPSINDLGEVVWRESISGYWQVLSSTRGQLTSDNADHYGPVINNLGDVVWYQSILNIDQYTHAVKGIIAGQLVQFASTTNSDVNRKYQVGGISNKGEVVWSTSDGSYIHIHSSTRGQLTSGAASRDFSAINSQGDVAWVQTDGNGIRQIYKLPVGAVTPVAVTSDSRNHDDIAINNNGEFIWRETNGGNDRLFSTTRNQLTSSGPEGNHKTPAINNCSDVVFMSDSSVGTIYRLGQLAPCAAVSTTNENLAQALTIALPQTVTATIDAAVSGEDWYKFNLLIGQTVRVRVNYDSTSPNQLTMDLYNAGGQAVTTQPGVTAQQFSYTTLADGSYYLRVKSTAGRFGYALDFAVQDPTRHKLTITKTGSGFGRVFGGVPLSNILSIPAASGSTMLREGQQIILKAGPDAGSLFVGWGGVCAGTTDQACTLTMDTAKEVTVEFYSTVLVTRAAGIDTGLVADDGYVNDLPIGFTLNFDGTPSTTFGVATNGWLSLSGQANGAYTNSSLPDSGLGSRAILPFFDDLIVGTGKIYYQTIGTAPNRQLVVQYHDVAFFGTPIIPMGDFEVIFFETTNLIKFLYRSLRNVQSFGNSATIGTMGPSGSSQYSYNTSSLHELQALSFNNYSSLDEYVPGSYSTPAFTWVDLSGMTADAPQDGGDYAQSAINFTWNTIPGANAYRLEVATATDGTGIVDTVTLGNLTAHSYPTTSLVRGTKYYARVAASLDSGVIWQNVSGFSDGIIFDDPPPPVNGKCGLSNGVPAIVAPSSEFCADGTIPSAVSGSGPWNWTCTGLYSGTVASCSAALKTWNITGTVPGGHGTITCPSPINNSASVNCNIVPAAGYSLSSFTDNSENKLSDVGVDEINLYTIPNVTEAHTLSAAFSPILFGAFKVAENVSNSDMTVDAGNNMHVVYERIGGVYYRTRNHLTGIWSSEEQLSATGTLPTIAVGSNSIPQVVYIDGGNVIYKARSDASWSTSTTIGNGSYADIDVDSNNKAHVALQGVYSIHLDDIGCDDIIYTNNVSNNFVTLTTYLDGYYDNTGEGMYEGRYYEKPSIKIDSSGGVYISASHHAHDLEAGIDTHRYSVVMRIDKGAIEDLASPVLSNSDWVGRTRRSLTINQKINLPELVYYVGNDIYSATISGVYGKRIWTQRKQLTGNQSSIWYATNASGYFLNTFVMPEGYVQITTWADDHQVGVISTIGPATARNPISQQTLFTYESNVAGTNFDLYASSFYPQLTVQPINKDFGAVGINMTSPATVTLTNTGIAELSISSMNSNSSLFVLTTGDGSGGTCGPTPSLLPGASCTVTVNFTPDSTGLKTGALQIVPTASSLPTSSFSLSGTGVIQYTLTFQSGSNGTVSPAGGQVVNKGDSSSAVTAAADPGYHFVNWTGTDGFVTTTSNPLTVSNVSSGITITANFEITPINGVCGSANGGTYILVKPAANLCNTGQASEVSGTGRPWSWSCAGRNGGNPASCSATVAGNRVDFSSWGTTDDVYVNGLPVGFTFIGGGVPHTTFGVSSNGWIDMASLASGAYANFTIPVPGLPSSPTYFPFFDDLVVGNGNIYYQTIGTAPNRQLVVQYHDVGFYAGTDIPPTPMGDFEVILYEDTSGAKFQYRALRSPRAFGNEATIGMQESGFHWQFSYNTKSLQEKMAIVVGTISNPGFNWIDLSGLTVDTPQDGGDTTQSSINVSWNPIPGANAYRLEVATATDGTGIVDAVTLGDVSSYIYNAGNLTNGTKYYVRVTASLDNGTIWQNPSGFTDGITVDKTVNGICGIASSSAYTVTPPLEALCATGTPSATPSGPAPWSWTCLGSSGGTDSGTCNATHIPTVLTIQWGPKRYSNQQSGSISFVADEPATFLCSLDQVSYAPCTSSFMFQGLANGSHTFSVKAVDFSENVSAPQTYSWYVNTTLAVSSQVLLPRTGQSKCYGATGAETDCDGSGQDGDLQAGVPWPNPRFTDNSLADVANPTITDNLTGLVWTKKANLMAAKDPSFDKDAPDGDGAVTWQHALDYAIKVNGDSYLNHADWRLPNRNELASLINSGRADNAIWLGEAGFQDVVSGKYWSSTTTAYGSNGWYLDTTNGSINAVIKSQQHYVWLVRGNSITLPQTGQILCYNTVNEPVLCSGTGQDGDLRTGASWPAMRFMPHQSGAVADYLTGLVWTADAGTPDAGIPVADECSGGSKDWPAALAYITCLNRTIHLGFSDWRLPNSIELASMNDASQTNQILWLGGIDPNPGQGFINFKNGIWWTSNTIVSSPLQAWAFDVDLVEFDPRLKNAGTDYYVWPVRGGYVEQKLKVTKTSGGNVSMDTGPLTWNGSAGTARRPLGQRIILTATADTDYSFTGWSGACTGTSTCELTMNQARNVTATFTHNPVNATCGTAHHDTFTAKPADNLCKDGTTPSSVTGTGDWTWICQGLYNGSDSPQCTAYIKTYAFSVLFSGNGGTSIISDPAGITCMAGLPNNNCSAIFNHGTPVILTATADGISQLASWTNADASTGNPVAVTMNGIKTVTATFETIPEPVLIYGKHGYTSILLAVGALTSNSTIMAKISYSSATTETILFDKGFTVTLEGGYDELWSTAGGLTAIKGTLKIKNGRVNMKGIRLRP